MSDFDNNLKKYLRSKGKLEAIEPDYKMAFSSLALRASAARIYLTLGDTGEAKKELDIAANLVTSILTAPRFVEYEDGDT